jgi:hypothetical protein
MNFNFGYPINRVIEQYSGTDTSRIASFASNVALVMFECPEERRVMMFHQVGFLSLQIMWF